MIVVASTSGQCRDCMVQLHKSFANLDQAQEYVAGLQAQANAYYNLLPGKLQLEVRRSTFHCIPIKEDD